MNNTFIQQNIIDHYKNPRYFNKLHKYTHHSKLTNYSCGDEIELWLNVENGIITNIGFQGSGCSVSIAATSLLCEELVGKNISEIEKIDEVYIKNLLQFEPNPSRMKCAMLSAESLKKLEATN
ncbi:iron-sulfur cluster assembly scaffold protein [bacterium]|nr:MAG: iron-sulfur cluster assembly scaffold protein [bacterium]